MRKFDLLDIRLSLFDGEGGATATATGDTGNQGGTQALPGSTRRGKSGEFDNVLYGKQSGAATAADAGTVNGDTHVAGGNGADGEPQTTVTSNTLEEKRKQFRQLVDGEFKDQYTEETQRIINQRFKETAQLREQLDRNQPILDMLMQRYNITDGDVTKLQAAIEDDDAYWSQAADEAGMSVEQYKQLQRLERENAQLLQAQRQQQRAQQAEQTLQRWYAEGEQLKQLYPSFDFNNEVKNQQFISMLRAGVPVQHAYEVIHMDEIKAGIAALQAQATEKQVVDGIRARGMRPTENGTSSQSAFTVKDDVSKLTKKDREEIARRVARGERVEF